MSILIKGMKMPKICNDCPLHFYEGQGICSCRVLRAIEINEELKPWKRKRKDCPLVEVPDKIIEDANKEYRCPFCGGKLSEPRYNGKYVARHCYDCHFDFQASYGVDRSEDKDE